MPDSFILYVDFDSTLFNTRQFADDLWHDIASQARLPFEQVKAESAKFYADQILGGYDYASHVTSYKLDPETMWSRLDSLVTATDYLYPDSAKFIQALRAEAYNPAILSFGESRFQNAKISPTIARLVNDTVADLNVTVVFRKKGEHIAALHPGEHGALVDDVPNQNLPPGFTEIHLDRTRKRAELEELPAGCIVSNLEQALEVIRLLHEPRLSK